MRRDFKVARTALDCLCYQLQLLEAERGGRMMPPLFNLHAPFPAADIVWVTGATGRRPPRLGLPDRCHRNFPAHRAGLPDGPGHQPHGPLCGRLAEGRDS